MDFFSHLLLGFILGQALQLDGSAQVILIVSSVILDIDAISIRGWEASFGFHRGPLHSILSAVLFSFLIGTAYSFFTRISVTIFISVVSMCLGGLLIHIFLDLLTSGGIKVLWPFSSEKFTLNLAHFVDPIILAVLLMASILIAFMNYNINMIRTVTILAIALLTVNFGVRYYEKDAASRTVKQLDSNASSEAVALPTIRLDRWSVFAKTPFENGYRCEMYCVDSIHRKILSKKTVKNASFSTRSSYQH